LLLILAHKPYTSCAELVLCFLVSAQCFLSLF
jgi:hypothetical protein